MTKYVLADYTENEGLRKDGVKYLTGAGHVKIRRGGLAEWSQAIREATEEVIGLNCNHNYISPQMSEQINAKAVATYLVAELCDDFKDVNGVVIPNTISNIRDVFETPENYSLVLELMEASFQNELFLESRLQEEIEDLKKS